MIRLDHLSHSSVSVFDCPRLGCLMVLKKKIKDRTLPLALGSAFHDLAATCYMLDSWDESAMLRAWQGVFKMHVDKNAAEGWTKAPTNEQVDRASADGELMIRNLFKRHGDILVPAFRDRTGLWVEHLIEIEISGIKLIGYIDMVLPEGGGVIVCDFKTGKHLPEEHNDETVSTYKDQLDLYALACRFAGLRVNGMKLVFPRLGEVVSYKPSVDGFNCQRKRVQRVMSFIQHHESLVKSGIDEEEAYDLAFPFEPHPTRCDWCSLKEGCAGFKEAAERQRQELESFRQSLRTRQ